MPVVRIAGRKCPAEFAPGCAALKMGVIGDVRDVVEIYEARMKYRKICSERQSGKTEPNQPAYVARLRSFDRLRHRQFSRSLRRIHSKSPPVRLSQRFHDLQGSMRSGFYSLWMEESNRLCRPGGSVHTTLPQGMISGRRYSHGGKAKKLTIRGELTIMQRGEISIEMSSAAGLFSGIVFV